MVKYGETVLVKWSRSVIKDATWEDYGQLKQKFPNLEDKG